MAFIADVAQRETKESNKPASFMCEDENLAYLQPARTRPIVYNQPYQKPTLKIQSDTTYSLSYKSESTPKRREGYGKYEKIIGKNTGKFDFDTVYKLSYPASSGKTRRAFVPKSCLSINGSHDMSTTQQLSYSNPGYVKTVSFKPYEGKSQHPVPMEYKTVTKESYQDFGIPVNVTRPRKREFWQTKFKTDYQTTSHLSYKYTEPLSKRIRVCYRPIITAQMQKDTVYSTSYPVPGCFVAKRKCK